MQIKRSLKNKYRVYYGSWSCGRSGSRSGSVAR